MMGFEHTEFRVRCVAEVPLLLPYHAGGMWHGILGRCFLEVGSGFDELLKPRVPADRQARFAQSGEPAPARLVLLIPRPRAKTGREREVGDGVEIGVRILGHLDFDEIARLRAVFQLVGQFAIGAARGGGEGRVRVVEVAIVEGPNERFEVADSPPRDAELTVELETPACIERGRVLVTSLDFATFFDAAHRRARAVSELWGWVDPRAEGEFQRLRATAPSVRTLKSRLRRLEWRRESNKPMRGVIGRVTFGGPLGEFESRLQAGRIVHVGKSATFGLGRYTFDSAPQAPADRSAQT